MNETNSNLEFRAIPSLDFLYEVNANGTIFRNIKSKKQLKIKLDLHHAHNRGYYAVWVNLKGQPKRVMIHAVVAECWLGQKPYGMEIDHIDRNSLNNWYWNLRYVTHSEQMRNRELSDELIGTATNNCYQYTMKYVAKPVCIANDDNTDSICFQSMIACSEYLGEKYNQEPEHFRAKLKKRRHKIYDYNIEYIKP